MVPTEKKREPQANKNVNFLKEKNDKDQNTYTKKE